MVLRSHTVGAYALVAALALGRPAALLAQGSRPEADLTRLSLEELMKIEVTSASRKEQRVEDVAAAIYVITHDDIRRSGITVVPELLRLAPGVQVARVNANQWAIAVRGFNNLYSNKLLVLVDGRTVYSRSFAGVFWNAQDLMLEDIDRIEVIRGVGAAVWGANAVNGIINIVTKPAEATKGTLVQVGVGTLDRAEGGIRYGGTLGSAVYRLHAKWAERGDTLLDVSTKANDSWRTYSNGFRVDWRRGADTFTADSSFATNEVGPSRDLAAALNAAPAPGGTEHNYVTSFLGRWTRAAAAGASLDVQMFATLFRQSDDHVRVAENVIDLDVKYHRRFGARHDVVLGGGFREFDDTIEGSAGISSIPKTRNEVFNAFAQDEIALSERVHLTLGSKVEHDSVGGWNLQPTARVMWEVVAGKQRAWGGVSRAKRMPSDVERLIEVRLPVATGPGGLPILAGYLGNPDLETEELVDVEVGYRFNIGTRAALDITGFRGHYNHLTTYEPVPPTFQPAPQPHIFTGARFGNLLEADSAGIEVMGRWQPVRYWVLDGSYSALRITPHPLPSSLDAEAAATDGNAPAHQWQMHSTVQLGRRAELNASLFHVGRLRNDGVPGYTRVDAGVELTLRPGVSLLVAGRNLFDRAHVEFVDTTRVSTLVPRSADLRLRWRF